MNEKKENKKIKNKFSLKEVAGIVIITMLVSFFIGFFVNDKKTNETLSHYEKELLENYQYILNNYYKEIDARDLVSLAIKGMVGNLDDPYADYIDDEQLEEFNLQINGEYQGIGIQITYDENERPIIVTVFEDSPAATSGLKSGDVLVSVANVSVENKTLEEVKQIVSEQKTNEFAIEYLRDNEQYSAMIRKTNVIIDSTTKKIFEENNKKIGYLKLESFTAKSYTQFKEKLSELEENAIDSLIIDLRYNTGGQLTAVDNIVSLFIKKDEVIYQMKEKDIITKYYSSGKFGRDYKIVVLINEYSASASELMASALKEKYGAVLIGTKTYGKGTAQEVIALKNGEQYKFTTKEWLTAKGNSIEKVGIEPNIKVEQSTEYFENPSDDNDEQLKEALKYLKK